MRALTLHNPSASGNWGRSLWPASGDSPAHSPQCKEVLRFDVVTVAIGVYEGPRDDRESRDERPHKRWVAAVAAVQKLKFRGYEAKTINVGLQTGIRNPICCRNDDFT